MRRLEEGGCRVALQARGERVRVRGVIKKRGSAMKRLAHRLPILILIGLMGSFLSTVYRVGGQTGELGILEYARECAERIATVPPFDCTAGTVAQITVNGEAPEQYLPHMSCDRPALLPYGEESDGQCVPYSRALVLRDDDKVQISAFCRQKLIRPADTYLYDEIDVILHSVETGSTCWFEATIENPNRDPAMGLDGRRVPSPSQDSPSTRSFWDPPAKTASKECGTCHDSDPFYYSPYVAQTGQLPADPFGKYANDIGAPFQAWTRPRSLSTRGNTCTGCHRIGSLHTCQIGIFQSIGEREIKDLDERGKTYPYSHWMPVDNLWTKEQWDVIYLQAVAQLSQCCKAPETPGCISTPIQGSPP